MKINLYYLWKFCNNRAQDSIVNDNALYQMLLSLIVRTQILCVYAPDIWKDGTLDSAEVNRPTPTVGEISSESSLLEKNNFFKLPLSCASTPRKSDVYQLHLRSYSL